MAVFVTRRFFIAGLRRNAHGPTEELLSMGWGSYTELFAEPQHLSIMSIEFETRVSAGHHVLHLLRYGATFIQLF